MEVMSEPQHLQQVVAIFQQVFAPQGLSWQADDCRQLERGVPPWDSLKHVEVLQRLEEDLKLEISADAAIAMTNFDEILRLLPKLPSITS